MYDHGQRLKIAAVITALVLAGCPSPGGAVATEDQTSDSVTKTYQNTQSTLTETIIDRTPTQTSTETEAPPTPTQTPTPVPTQPNTETPTEIHPYRGFADVFDRSLQANAKVPLQILGYGNRSETWYVVINATAPSKNQVEHSLQWTFLSNAYAAAVVNWEKEDWSGKVPDRMIALDWNSANYSEPPKAYSVQTKWARKIGNGSISSEEYHSRWGETVRNQTQRERQIAKTLNRDGGTKSYHNATAR